jgi:hypothetical protein
MSNNPRNPAFDSPLSVQNEENFLSRLRRMVELAEQNAPPVILMSELNILNRTAMVVYPESYAQEIMYRQLEEVKISKGWCRMNGCGERQEENNDCCPKHSREREEETNVTLVGANIEFFNKIGRELKAYLWSKGYNTIDKVNEAYHDDRDKFRKLLIESNIERAVETVFDLLKYLNAE